MTALYWARSDLRSHDNQALYECLKLHTDVIFVFAETKSFKQANQFRKSFLGQSVSEISEKLRKRGFRVISTDLLFHEYLPELFKSHPFTSLYFTREYAWDERLEERSVSEFCQTHDVTIHSYDQSTLITENDLPFKLENMPFIFTEFRKKIEHELKVKPLYPVAFESDGPLIHPDNVEKFHGGESFALARLSHYLWDSDAIQTYKDTRNGLIHFNDSTKLSPWLNTGCLSARSVYHQLKMYEVKVCENESTYWLFFELLWRDYFKFFSLKFGKRIFLAEGINPGSSPNLSDVCAFNSWCEGKTHDSFVNANMTELNQTGWMSNRGRQNVASYLIHDLGVNWTWGASYFEKKLIDYDPDLNWGNWLYLSGRGSDPRARKFNTIKQAETYDPVGEYRQLWR